MNLILGIDPGLQKTGWGIVRTKQGVLEFMACGTIRPPKDGLLADRLLFLHASLQEVIAAHRPATAAIEETFVSVNGQSTLKLGQARGALLLSLRSAGLPVAEYAPNSIKKALVGSGHAEKAQVAMMVRTLLCAKASEFAKAGEDAMDALAIAICHAHHARV